MVDRMGNGVWPWIMSLTEYIRYAVQNFESYVADHFKLHYNPPNRVQNLYEIYYIPEFNMNSEVE